MACALVAANFLTRGRFCFSNTKKGISKRTLGRYATKLLPHMYIFLLWRCNVNVACGHRSCTGNIFDTYLYFSNRSSNPKLQIYEIPVGGMSIVGEWGYIDAFREMIEQVGAVMCTT